MDKYLYDDMIHDIRLEIQSSRDHVLAEMKDTYEVIVTLQCILFMVLAILIVVFQVEEM